MITTHINRHTGAKIYKPGIKIIENKKAAEDSLVKGFMEKLKVLYGAEKTMIKSIPGMIRNAKSEELVEVLELQRSLAGEQLLRVEAVFALFHTVPQAQSSAVITALVKETEKVLQSNKGMIRDAEAIALIQQVQHLKIALYGTLCSFARTLGQEMTALLLEDSLNEEKQADKNLSTVAEVFINPVAAYGYPVKIAASGKEEIYLISNSIKITS